MTESLRSTVIPWMALLLAVLLVPVAELGLEGRSVGTDGTERGLVPPECACFLGQPHPHVVVRRLAEEQQFGARDDQL